MMDKERLMYLLGGFGFTFFLFGAVLFTAAVVG